MGRHNANACAPATHLDTRAFNHTKEVTVRVQHRMLSWRITRDAAVASLSSDSARLLFTWLVAFGDNLGRVNGEPAWVRAEVGIRMQWSEQDVARWLQEMHDSGLVVWYEVDGLRYVQFANWDKHQRLVGNMRATSDHPAPGTNGVHTPYERGSHAVSTEGEGEGEGTTTPVRSRSQKQHPSAKGSATPNRAQMRARRAGIENRERTKAIDRELGRGDRHE